MPFAMRSFAATTKLDPKWVLLGTDKGKGIYRASWNAATGELGPPELAIATERPSYLALHPTLPLVYAANETNHGDGKLSVFHLDPQSATLSALQQVSANGMGSCYNSIDRAGRCAFVANYNSGSVASYDIGIDGTLKDAGVYNCQHENARGTTGPNKQRQDSAHIHCVTVSPDDNFVLACDLGKDAIEIFHILRGGKLLDSPTRIATREGSGPRHVAFHPNGRWLYCIHELDCTIDLFDWNVTGTTAALTQRPNSVISTLSPGAALKGSTACEIRISDDGRFAYANTRGENSLVVYRIDAKTGLLTEQQRVNAGGDVTRIITFDPSRKWLLCANQGSSTVTVFAHDKTTGRLSEKPKTFAADTPMFTLFV